jgi:L-amino acid N-acyltransferase YncA
VSALIRQAIAADAEAIARIYEHYIGRSSVTFEEQPVTAEQMGRRMAEVFASGFPWLVAEEHGIIVGYAYAGRWKDRDAYRFCVESTIYLTPAQSGRGLGKALYRPLIEQLRTLGLHAAVGCIALPNEASVALHEKLGFRKVGHFSEVGFKFGKWIDVGYWQLLL